MLISEIHLHYSEFIHQRETDPVNTAPPGGETIAEIAQRVTEALDEIASRHPGERVIVVSHGLAIGVMRCLATGEWVGRASSLIPENAAVIPVHWPGEEIR